MAQQQDPNGDPTRGSAGQQGVVAGSQDTYRPKGFSSPNVTPPSGALSSITSAPGATAAPANVTWGKYVGPSTPGIEAAIASGGSGQPGPPGSGLASMPNKQGPIIGAIDALSFANHKPNNSALQDIGGALYQGLPISDYSWSLAGYGPGGVPLTQPATGLRSITASPVANTMNAMLAKSQQQQPVGTTPANAVIRPY